MASIKESLKGRNAIKLLEEFLNESVLTFFSQLVMK